jgi:hypothetical protein
MHEEALAAVAFGPIASVPAIGITMRANWMPTRLHSAFIAMLHDHMANPNVTPLRRAAG